MWLLQIPGTTVLEKLLIFLTVSEPCSGPGVREKEYLSLSALTFLLDNYCDFQISCTDGYFLSVSGTFWLFDVFKYFFFQESRGGMTCYSSLYDDGVSVFIFSCKFYSTHKQTHLQQPWCIKGPFFPSPLV